MRAFATAIAITVGILILLGYFLPLGPLSQMRVIMLQWGVILAAFALLVGVANLFTVHGTKVRRRSAGWGYSLLLVVTLGLTILVVGYFTPTNPVSLWIFNYIQVPIEGSLVALLAIVLIFAGVRMFTRRPTGHAILFLSTALIVMVGATPLLGRLDLDVFQRLRDVVVQIPAVAGARGILLGVALGTIATGLRVLLGADRPYGG